MRLSVSVMMAGYDKRGSSEDHIRRKEGDGEGSAGKEAEGSQLNPNDLAKLRKVFILPVKDVSLKLKRAWKMTKAQQGLACVVCGKPLSNLKVAQTHVQNKSHQLKQKEHQLLEYLPTIPKLSTSYFCALSSFLTRVFNQHSAQAQLNDRHKIANRLEHYLKEDGLDATVCLFGSSGSGFALTSSNVNLSVSTAGTSGNQSVIAGCMRSVAVSLKKRGDVYGNVQEDYFSFNKIPRILFEHLKSGLSCEVRVEAGNPVALCSLLKLYAAVDERCVQLSTLFRLWAKVCRVDIQENGHYPGHMFVVMAIYFLQQIGVLPVLHQLHNSKQKSGATVNKRHGNRKNKQGDNTTTQLETGRGVTVVQMKQMEEGEGGGEVDSGATEVVLNDDDDDVVFVEECEGEREVNEVNKVEEGEEEGSMGTGEGMPTKLPHVPDIDYLTDLTELQNRWKSTNTQSLGELWYHLLKYYAVEFNIEQHAVSIRQKQKLLRLTRQWGEVRLAVEDPLIPKSNLARAASSRQVYDYLMSSLRLSALYFSGCSDQMQWATLDEPVVAENIGAKQDVRTKPSPSIQDKESWQEPDSSAKSPPLLQLDQCVQEDDKEGGDEGGSIEHQDSSILFASVPSETSSHELLNKNDCTSIDNIANMVQRLKISEDCVVGIKATSIEEGIVCTSSTPKQDECSPHCSTSSTPHSPPETAPPPSLPSSGTGSSPQSLPVICASPLEAGLSTDKQLGLKFAAENFVFLSYPQSCLNCKKLKHSILECPELDLAVEYRKHLPRHLPSPAALQQVHQCFTENMSE
jgi:DNA polymerase sigma